MESSSAFIVPTDFSAEWRDVTLFQRRSHTLVHTATRYGRRFLLKALSPECAQLTDYRLQQEREFQLGVQLVHPNIAATYSLEDVDGVGRCIVQEWIDGVTLGEWLQTKPAKAAQERVFTEIIDALEYLHSLQLVHHDLKADNILIFFNNPDCESCDAVKERLSNNEFINQLINDKKLIVLAIYPYNDNKLWKKTKYPKMMINGWNQSHTIEYGELYDLPTLPCFYLLDKDYSVLVKNEGSLNKVEAVLKAVTGTTKP